MVHLVVDVTRPLKDRKKCLNTFNSLPVSRYAPLPNEVLSLDRGGDPMVIDIHVFLFNDFIDDYAMNARIRIKSLTRPCVVFSMRGTKKMILKKKF